MKVEKLVEMIGSDFYTGVPDSQLKALCNYLMDRYGIDPKHHIIAANEGNCTALAAGYHLATGKVPVVYMQNSGEGNIINPVASLLNDKVYAIPVVFIVGWRGEPGIHDEPQHIYQGEVTVKLLVDMDIATFVIGKETTEEELATKMEEFKEILATGKDVAFVIRKGALTDAPKVEYKNENHMVREEIIQHIVALGVAINKQNQRIWCVDGDGAVLMHMGSMAVLGANKPKNLIHVVINNGAHETVGGMPTVAGNIDLVGVAKACGYPNAVCVDTFEDLDKELEAAKARGELSLIEVKCSIGAREDLGRPTTTALENKQNFMEYLQTL